MSKTPKWIRGRKKKAPKKTPQTTTDLTVNELLPSSDNGTTDAEDELVVANPVTAEFILELKNVTKTFPGPPPVHAIRPTDLQVRPGDYLSIIGHSGSGKSTLLNLLGLLDMPTTGQYLVNGIDTTAISQKRRAHLRGQTIGFVFQSFHLLSHRTVLENVLLATMYSQVPRAERLERAKRALHRVGLSHRLNFLPTILSGGERQRVAIARAVVSGPQVILADEPTGNLDTENTDIVLDLFDELHTKDGITMIVITHEQEVSERSKRRVRITDGYVTEEVGAWRK